MKIKTTILIISIGLAFSSCKTDHSKNAETESIKTNPAEKETTSQVEKPRNSDELTDKVKEYITTKYLTEADLRTISEDQRKFQLYLIDLNNDGKQEVFVNFNTSYFCGTGGCSILLLNDQLDPITKFTVTRTPPLC